MAYTTENSETSAYPCNSLLSNSGLTKREYFAGLAMQGLISCPINIGNPSTPKEAKETICARAVLYADELLKQLEPKTP
jgi:hypothetical protein